MTAEIATYQPHGGAKELFYAQDKRVLFVGVAGGGKTRAVVEKCHLIAKVFAGARILWVRMTRASLAESVLEIYEDEVMSEEDRAEILGSDPPDRSSRVKPYVYAQNITQYEGKRYRGRSRIVLGGLDKVEKTFSAKYDIIVVFEAREVMSVDIIEKLQRALRNYVVPFPADVILDTNPGSEFHPIYKMVTAPDSDWRVITSLHRDNPTYYDHDAERWTERGEDYVIGTLSRLTGARRRQLYLGEWCSEEGMVWEPWKDEVHMFSGTLEEHDRYWRIRVHWPDSNRIGTKEPGATEHEDPSYVPLVGAFASMDWGYHNPSSLSVYAADADRTLYRVAHVYHSEQPLEWWADWVEKLVDRFRMSTVVVDPSRPEVIRYFNDRLGPRGDREGHRVCRKANNDFMSGRDIIHEALQPADGSAPKVYFMRGARLHQPDPLLAGPPGPDVL